jgi:hypothetical protein
MTGEEIVLSGHASGIGEPSRESDSGVISPLTPTWLGDAGALLKQATNIPARSVTDEFCLSDG